MEIDPSGLTTLDSWQPSKEGDLLAYQLSEGGTEESVVRVMDVVTGDVVDGPIDLIKLDVGSMALAALAGARVTHGRAPGAYSVQLDLSGGDGTDGVTRSCALVHGGSGAPLAESPGPTPAP